MTSRTPDSAAPSREGSPFFVAGISPEMLTVQRLMAEIAPTDIPLLLVGESGTGKEIVALQIHQLSSVRQLPFLKLSCATLDVAALQSHLKEGLNGGGENRVGTIFFDEINELDANCQRSLLRSFPEGNGISAHLSSQSRFISCTTLDLEAEVQSGRFRGDLFYRFNQICLRLPPLRNRKDDIPLLTQHFLQKYRVAFRRKEMSLASKTLQTLMDYHWPGNIRELENVVKKIVALENEELGTADLKMRSQERSIVNPTVVSRSLKATARAASQLAERQLILQTLERTHWNRKKAAEALQISYKALLYKLKQIQVPGPERL